MGGAASAGAAWSMRSLVVDTVHAESRWNGWEKDRPDAGIRDEYDRDASLAYRNRSMRRSAAIGGLSDAAGPR